MRWSMRSLSVIAVLSVGLISLVWPASARSRTTSPAPPKAVVHGRDSGVSRDEATSFDLLGRSAIEKGASLADAPLADTGRSVPLAPQQVSGFDALADPDSAPSDTTGARGDSFIVAAVNTQVAVYDLNGTQVLPPLQLEALNPASVGHFTFDPKVVYDQYDDTFILAYLVQEDSPRLSLILTVAIPNATAPSTGTWCSRSFAGDALPGGRDTWADYPGLGYTDTRVTITTNEFEFPSTKGSFRSSQVMTVDKAGLYDCGQSAPIPTVFAGTATRDDRGKQAFTLRPAETVGASPGAQLMVSFTPVRGKKDYLTLWRIRPTATGFALKRTSVATGKVSRPPPGTQEGGGLTSRDTWWDTGDTRLINAFYDADRNEVFTAHTVFRNFKPDKLTGGYPEAANRWYEIVPATNLRDSVIGRKGIIGDAEVDVGWPTVATNAAGVLFVTYNRASEPRDEFISAWVSTIQPDATVDSEFLLHAGAATYDAIVGPERWGDFTAINRDPVSPQNVATFNQYAESTVQWQQVVSLVTDN